MARKSSIKRLPPKIRQHIEQQLAADNLTLDELIADLQQRFPQAAQAGDLPSRSAVHRYGVKLERRLAAVKAATEAAKVITQHAGDDKDDRSEALTALIQSELIEAMMQLQDADDPEVDQQARVKLLSAAAKNIATLTRSSTSLKQFRADVEADLIKRQRQKLNELGKTGTVDPDILAHVLNAAYGEL